MQSVDYTNDELGRLVEADRGLLSGGSITLNNFNHEWTLGQTGNWNRSKLDLNGDADFADTDELDENNPLASGGSEHFNKANELTARDTDNNGSDNYTLAYDEVGNMTDDGKEYEYVYDAFGRLRKVKNTSNQALVSEYWYNGLGHRITWHADTTRSGGGAPDGSVNTDDPKVHFVYNERWQQVAAYRQANGSGVDTHPKEQFVHHNAGHGGYGGSSYIDGVILRDDHEDDWTESADSTLERRVYYCQNWRADVVALLAENGRVVERAWYEPYGTPHGMSPADFSGTSDDTNDHYLVPDGDADADDSFVYLDLFGVSAALSDMTGSSDPGDGEYGRPNGTIDSDDYFYFLDQYSVAANLGRNVLSAGHDGATASHGAGSLRNRRGLAGYEWDPHVRRYHVRNRVLYPEIGRWTRRDPLGYVDGMGLVLYSASQPMNNVDPFATDARICGGAGCQSQPVDPGDSDQPLDPLPPTPYPPTDWRGCGNEGHCRAWARDMCDRFVVSDKCKAECTIFATMCCGSPLSIWPGHPGFCWGSEKKCTDAGRSAAARCNTRTTYKPPPSYWACVGMSFRCQAKSAWCLAVGGSCVATCAAVCVPPKPLCKWCLIGCGAGVWTACKDSIECWENYYEQCHAAPPGARPPG